MAKSTIDTATAAPVLSIVDTQIAPLVREVQTLH
jgi:hypothetical protein